MEIDSSRILMDTCIKYSFKLTSNMCDKHKMIYVNPYGEVKRCSFDGVNIGILKEPKDFISLYKNSFPQQPQDSCKLMGM